MDIIDDLFDLAEARERRNAGMAKALETEEPWKMTGYRLMEEAVPAGFVGMGEDFRVLLRASGLPNPHSPKCWGAFFHHCARLGMIEDTGGMGRTKGIKSHARRTKIYLKVSGLMKPAGEKAEMQGRTHAEQRQQQADGDQAADHDDDYLDDPVERIGDCHGIDDVVDQPDDHAEHDQPDEQAEQFGDGHDGSFSDPEERHSLNR